MNCLALIYFQDPVPTDPKVELKVPKKLIKEGLGPRSTDNF